MRQEAQHFNSHGADRARRHDSVEWAGCVPADVPSPIDLRRMEDAQQWTSSAMSKRPWRTEFFAAIASVIGSAPARVLELGSGPGFLAEHLLRSNAALRYVALDFSAAMHELAAQRLGALAGSVQFGSGSVRVTPDSLGVNVFCLHAFAPSGIPVRRGRFGPAMT